MEHKLSGRFASFQIQQFLAAGSIADIYLARDDNGQTVVLKALRSSFYSDAGFARRLFLEGEILSTIQTAQPSGLIPRCLQMGRESTTGNPFLALTYAEGQSLRSLMNAGRRFTLSDIINVGSSISIALEAVHNSGFCHHDVCADNIIVQSDDTKPTSVTLIGFGMACLDNTQSDVSAGKPLAMSPEECRGEPITHASDLYSLGVLLYEMAIGHPPFTSQTDNPAEVMEMHWSAELRIAPGLDEPLRQIILALLSKAPSESLAGTAQLRKLAAETASSPSPDSTQNRPVYPLAIEDASAGRLGWELNSSAALERLLAPAEVYISEPEKLLKQPFEERLDFPIHQVPEIPNLSEIGLRTPSQDPMRKEPSDDEFPMRELFPSETLLRESARENIPLDDLGLPVIDSPLLKEPPPREPSDSYRDSEKQSLRREPTKEEKSVLQEALVGPGAVQDLDSQNKTVVPPAVPVKPPPSSKPRRGMMSMAAVLIGILGLLSAGGFFLFFKHHAAVRKPIGGGGYPPPVTRMVRVCKESHMLPGPYCPPEALHDEPFEIGKEPKEICTYHHKPVPPPEKIRVRICTVSGKVANPYCPKDKIRVEEFTKGQEPKDICAVHHKTLPPPQKVRVRICTVSGKVANRYCPSETIRVEEFIKGKQPTARCTVHHKPDKPKIEYVTIKKCPVGGETYTNPSARFCTDAAHKQNGQYPRLISVRIPKR